MTTELVNAALQYAAQGWAIFPLTPGGKMPVIPKDEGGNGVYDATTDPAVIRKWWQRWPEANIGLACGPSGLLAVDLDRHGKADGLAAWAALGIAHDPTPTSNTPNGGRHLVFSVNGTHLGNSSGSMPEGIDIRGDGGYIVAPPSRLPDGRRWAWDRDAHPNMCKPAPVPEVVKLLLTSRVPSSRPTEGGSTAPAGGDRYALAALKDELGSLALATEGARNETLNTAAFSLGQLVGAGLLDRGDVEARLLAQARAIGLGDREAQATIASGLTSGEKHPRQVPEPTRPAPMATPTPAGQPAQASADFDLCEASDLANSQRLATWHGSDLRWCDPWEGWLTWDSKRWQRDNTREVDRRANETARQMIDMAKEKNREAFGKWAFSSLSGPRRREMINGARALLPVLPEALDADPWMLTVNNGTIDLRTGELLPHDKGQMITKLAPVDYDPAARCPTWEAFLDRIMAGNRDLIAFLQRAVGYSLTGDTREQCLFILFGGGSNGKSTLIETLATILDEYHEKTPTETLLIKRSGGIPNDVARLRGARLVTAIEAEQGQRMAESLVKQMTGGDTIAARFMRAEWFDFKPEFKLWLGTNHKPVIRGTDLAIWRRIRLIPFTVRFYDWDKPDEYGKEPKQDKQLKNKLKAELPGILAWAVRGCLEWQQAGLGVPSEVQRATADYQAEMDILADFIEDRCLVKLTARASAKDLYSEYASWCEAEGEKPIAKRTFGLRLQERGFTQARTGQERFWQGIGLLSDPEQLDLIDTGQPRETIDL